MRLETLEKSPRRLRDLDTDEKVEIFVKVGTFVALVVAGVWTLFEYFQRADEDRRDQRVSEKRELELRDSELAQRRAEFRLKQVELNHRFWEQRAQACREIAVTAAEVAAAYGRDKSANIRFDAQYWGASPIIESPASTEQPSLETALIKFEERRRECKKLNDSSCWEDLLVCVTDIGYECTRMLCKYLDSPEAVDVCSAERMPQCDLVRN